MGRGFRCREAEGSREVGRLRGNFLDFSKPASSALVVRSDTVSMLCILYTQNKYNQKKVLTLSALPSKIVSPCMCCLTDGPLRIDMWLRYPSSSSPTRLLLTSQPLLIAASICLRLHRSPFTPRRLSSLSAAPCYKISILPLLSPRR